MNNIRFVFEDDALAFLAGFEEGPIVMDKQQRIKNGDGRLSFIGKYSGYYMAAKWVNDKREGEATIYTPEGIQFISLFYSNDVVNGICIQRDKNDKVVFKGMVRDGMKDGVCEEFDTKRNTKVLLEYDHGVCVARLMVYPEDQSFYAHTLMKSGRIDKIGQYDQNYKLHGEVVELDENETLTSLCIYEHGIMVQRAKVFHGKEMIQYDENGQEIYKGCYSDHISSRYPRHGEGKEYDPIKHSLVFCGLFELDERKEGKLYDRNGRLLYQGSWSYGVAEGHGIQYTEKGEVMYEGNWVNGYLYLPSFPLFTYGDYETRGRYKVNRREELPKWILRAQNRPPELRLPLDPATKVVSMPPIQPPSPSTYLGQSPASYPKPSPSTYLGQSPASYPKPSPVSYSMQAPSPLTQVPMGHLPVPAPYPTSQGILQSTLPQNPHVGMFYSIPRQVTNLVIGANTCNLPDLQSIDFSQFPLLAEVYIEDNCFQYVYTVKFTNLQYLKLISVGRRCFSPVIQASIPLPKTQSFLIIRECMALEVLTVGAFSFLCFTDMLLDQLPSLRTLVIGDLNTQSYCFTYAPQLKLSNLNSLELIQLGCSVFMKVRSVIFDNMKSLRYIQLGSQSLSGDGANVATTKSGTRYQNELIFTSE